MVEIEPSLLGDCRVDAASMHPDLRLDAQLNPFTSTAQKPKHD